jgi:PIN domain nuclease of toxin-antitoxin system
MQTDPGRLGTARTLVADDENELFLSAASSWEIAIKYALGRLPLPEAPATWVPDRLRRSTTTPIALEHHHVLHVAQLPLIHRDPFDRVLVAQAQVLGLPILTSDRVLSRYEVETIQV